MRACVAFVVSIGKTNDFVISALVTRSMKPNSQRFEEDSVDVRAGLVNVLQDCA